MFVKCSGCAWCGEAAAGELLPAVYLPPPSPLPSPPPPLASSTETAETGASAAPGNDGSLSLSSSLAASASRIGARSNLTSLSSLTQADLHELHHAVTDELTKTASLTKAGGADYLHTLTGIVPTAANAGYYGSLVAEKAVLRRLVEAGQQRRERREHARGADLALRCRGRATSRRRIHAASPALELRA